jgi:hypothetical protein
MISCRMVSEAMFASRGPRPKEMKNWCVLKVALAEVQF